MTIGSDFVVRPGPRRVISSGTEGMVIGEDFVVGRGVEAAEASQRHAILVSHPDHRITAIGTEEALCAGAQRPGIGNMTIGLDFRVAPET
jgi:hypothetical protein